MVAGEVAALAHGDGRGLGDGLVDLLLAHGDLVLAAVTLVAERAPNGRRQSRLSHASGSDDSDEPDLRSDELFAENLKLLVPPEQRRALRRPG